jgi:uncharacterized protein (DUF4415 family)
VLRAATFRKSMAALGAIEIEWMWKSCVGRLDPSYALPRAKGEPMKKGSSKRLTREQMAELKSVAALPDDAIDTSDAPELLDWSGAKRGLFYRPLKQQLTLRLDADVVAWFKRHTTSDEGYQTRINRALREYVQGQAGRKQRSGG